MYVLLEFFAKKTNICDPYYKPTIVVYDEQKGFHHVPSVYTSLKCMHCLGWPKVMQKSLSNRDIAFIAILQKQSYNGTGCKFKKLQK